MGQAAATPEIFSSLLKLLSAPEGGVRYAARVAMRDLSIYVPLKDRSKAVRIFLALARSRNAEERDAAYNGLRNLLTSEPR
jgi:hypothetical protein